MDYHEFDLLTENKRIVFDIDETILTGGTPSDNFESARPKNSIISLINDLYDMGLCEVVIMTARHPRRRESTIHQLNKFGVKYHTLIMGKPPAIMYIDDKAFNPIGKSIDEIRKSIVTLLVNNK